jgi:PAS domain S-box-containing protein/putative nucleotidyltransferase with HDIG domain
MTEKDVPILETGLDNRVWNGDGERSAHAFFRQLYSIFRGSLDMNRSMREVLSRIVSFFRASCGNIITMSIDSDSWTPETIRNCRMDDPGDPFSVLSEEQKLMLWSCISERTMSFSKTPDNLNQSSVGDILALLPASSFFSVPFSTGTHGRGAIVLFDIPDDRMPQEEELSSFLIFSGFIGNICSRAEAERDLAITDTIVNEQLDCIACLDPGHRISFANRSFCRFFGLSGDTVSGMFFPDLFPAGADEDIQNRLKELSFRIPVTFIEEERTMPSGGTVWQRWMFKGIFDTSEDLVRILGVGKDVTRVKMVEQELKSSIDDLERNFEATINGMGKIIEIKDPYTAGHQQNVALLARRIAEEMGLPQDTVETVYYASLVHDIGKLQIPSEILNKPGRLNDLEYSLVKNHPLHSAVILKTVDFPWPIADIVVQHHERMDGSGYPEGIKGDKIGMEARIMGVADVVEAMTAHRPYRISQGLEKALEEIHTYSGILYDPQVVRTCIDLFRVKNFEFERKDGPEKLLPEPF